jgi:hypothetical protein
MAAVEMSAAPPCNFLPILSPNTPELCPGAIDIFVEDWETGDDGWTRTSVGVFPDWEDQTRDIRDFALTSNLPKDRAGSAAYAQNPPIGERGGGSCAPGTQPEGDYSGEFSIDSSEITIPADAENLRLRFDHYVASEATFDGGQVEVSVNGGAFQLVPQANYEFNQPNSQFAAAPPTGNNTNPNAGEFAWNGTDTGTQDGSWGTTIVDLSTLAGPGDKVKLRFKFSQDGCNGVDGWYVDNIHLYFCPNLEAPVLSLGADYENPDTNGSYTLMWTRPAGASGPDTVQQSTASCAPLVYDDAENGLGQWTATTTGTDPALAWESVGDGAADDKPAHSGTTFRARGTNGVAFANSAAILTLNGPLTIPTTGQTLLSFSDWDVNEGEDAVFVEVSTDGGATWIAVYQHVRSAQVNDGAVAFATEPLFKREINLAAYAGQSIGLRFRYQTGPEDRPASVPLGWYLDDIKVENDSWSDVVTTNGTSHLVTGALNGTRCYRARTTYALGGQQALSPFSNIVSATVHITVSEPPTCIEDNDPRVSYANGWHTVNSPNASDGHFRMKSGNDTQHAGSLMFTVPDGQFGKITYYYAKSTKGGTADVYIDGMFKGTINYKGSVGKLNNPEFSADYKAEYGNIPAGTHTLEIRMSRDGVYVDRFCLENSNSSAGTSAAGPGQTSSQSNTVGPGNQSTQSFTLPSGTEGIAVVAEISPELPIQLALIDPSGAVTTATANAAGIAVINTNARPGIYTLRVLNVSFGPVQVWTATTPYVRH